jgi:uncharacterized membrane protein YtjA (UPF0391 family)
VSWPADGGGQDASHAPEDWSIHVLYYALVFLVVGVIAGTLNLAGVSAVAVQISWILFLIGILLVAIHVITGRSARVA